MTKSLLGLCLALSVTACGSGGPTIELGNKTPQEASADIAEAICEQNAECGGVSIDCSSTENGLDCTSTIEPVVYTECYAELQPEIQQDLTDCNLTDAQKGTVETCLNALLDRPCFTQGEIDAYIAAVEAGDETASLGEPPPPECEQVDAIFESCGG